MHMQQNSLHFKPFIHTSFKCALNKKVHVINHVQVDMAIDGMECEEFGDYLLAKGLHEDVVSNIVSNRIDGQPKRCI